MDDKVYDCLASIWSKATAFDPHSDHLTYHRCAMTMPMEFESILSSATAEPTLDSSGIPWRQVVARCCSFSSDIDRTDYISFTDVVDGSRRQFIVYLRTSKSRLSRGREQFSSCDCHCHAKSHVSLQTYLLVFRRHRNHHRPLHHHHHHHYQHRPSPTAIGLQRQPETPTSVGFEQSPKDCQRPMNLETIETRHQAPHQDRSRGHGIADERRQELCRRLHRHVDSLVGLFESRIKSVQDGSRNRCYSSTTQSGCYPFDPLTSGVSRPSSCCRIQRHYPRAPEPTTAARVWPMAMSSIVWSIYRSETDGREFRLYILHMPTSVLSSSSSGISNFLTDSRAEFATGIMMMMMMMMIKMMIMMRKRRRRRKRKTTTIMIIIMTATIVVMIDVESEVVPLVWNFRSTFYDRNSLGVTDVLVVAEAAVVDVATVFESPINHGQATTTKHGALGRRPSDPPGRFLRLAAVLQCSSSALLSMLSSSTTSSLSFLSSLLSSPPPSSLSSSSSSSSASEAKSIAVPSSTDREQKHRIEATSSHNDNFDLYDHNNITDHNNVIDVNLPGRPHLDLCGRDRSTSSDIMMPCFSILLYKLLLVVIFFCWKWQKSGSGICRGDSSRRDRGGGECSRKKQVSHSEGVTSSSSPNRTSDPPNLRGSRQGGSRKYPGGGRGLGNIWRLPVLFCLAFSLCMVDGGKAAEVGAPHLGLNPGIRHVPRHFHLRNLCSSRYLTISTSLPTASADNLVSSTNITAESMGPHSLIRMRNRLNHYLCFDREGIMKSKRHPDETCNFFEIHTQDHKTEFLSSFNLTWYVGFDRTGCPLPGGSRLMSRIRKSHKWIESESTRLKRPRKPANRAALLSFEARLRKTQRRHSALAATERQRRGYTGNETSTAGNKTVRIRHQKHPKNVSHKNNTHDNMVKPIKQKPIKRKSTKEKDHHRQQQQQQRQQKNQLRRRHAAKDRKSQNENRKRKCPVNNRERKLPDKCFQFVKDTPRSSLHHHPHQSPSSKN